MAAAYAAGGEMETSIYPVSKNVTPVNTAQPSAPVVQAVPPTVENILDDETEPERKQPKYTQRQAETNRKKKVSEAQGPADAPAVEVLEADASGNAAVPADSLGAIAGEATPDAPGSEPLQARAVVVDIDSERLDFDKERDAYVATGRVHVIISEQNTDLVADKVVYDQNNDMMFAEGHVTITRNGTKTLGTYAKIDLTRQSALIQDPKVSVREVRLHAKHMLASPDGVELVDGRYVMDRVHLVQSLMGRAAGSSVKGGGPAQRDRYDQAANSLMGLAARDDYAYNDEQQAVMNSGELDKLATRFSPQVLDLEQGSDSPYDLDSPYNDGTKSVTSNLSFHVKEIDIYRGEDGYDDILLKKPSIYWGKHKILGLVTSDLSYDENSHELTYLGPDIGIDPDYGGAYFGPGYDFRVGEKGTVRFSPIVTLGSGNQYVQEEGFGSWGPGVGAVVHYRRPGEHGTFLDAAYTSKNNMPVLNFEQKLLDHGKTRFHVAANEDYTAGIGSERPQFIAQVRDSRKLLRMGKFDLFSYTSAGWARDNIGNYSAANYFVQTNQTSPVMAGRVQLQADIRNNSPLLSVGDWFNAGVRGQMALSGYSTGDAQGIFRAGPNFTLNVGNRFLSTVQYFATAQMGNTPFVFDTYYQGAHAVEMTNALRINRFLTVGMQNNLSLQRDNSRGDLLTGNSVFALIGPKDLKFNLAYDFIQKRSFFGINYIPQAGNNAVDFDKLRIIQPQLYSPTTGAMPVGPLSAAAEVAKQQ